MHTKLLPLGRPSLLALVVLLVGAPPTLRAQDAQLDTFFNVFATQWVEGDPDLATGTRYFTGEKQQGLERQLTPQTREWQMERIELAKKGLRELKKFDAAKTTPTQRISAELMRWQLDAVANSEPYLDYNFPIDQFGGTNVTLVDNLTVRHPLTSERSPSYSLK